MIWLDILHHQIDLEDEFLEKKMIFNHVQPMDLPSNKDSEGSSMRLIGHPWGSLVKSSFPKAAQSWVNSMVNCHRQTQPPKFQKEGFAQICFTHKTNKKPKCEDSGAVPNGWIQDMLVSYAVPVPNIPNLAGQPSSSPLDASSNLRKTSAKGNSWNRFQERWKRTRY